MKKRILLFSAIAGTLYLSLNSFNVGPTFKAQNLNCSESPNSNATCGQATCHNDGGMSTLGEIKFRVRKKSAGITSAPVTSYQNDSEYYVTVIASHPSLTSYGFQAEILDTGDAATGVMTNFAHTTIDTVNGVPIAGHDSGIPMTDSATFEWKAPSSDSADITLYGAGAITDGASEMGDSLYKLANVVLTYEPPTSVNNINASKINIKAFPNPIMNGNINLEINTTITGTYKIIAYSANGQKVYQRDVNLNSNSVTSINTDNWNAGIYILHITKDGAQKTIAVVKQ